MITEYLDWSDRGLELYEAGQGVSKFAEASITIDDETSELMLHLRKNTKMKKDFSVIIPSAIIDEIVDKFGKHEETT